MNPETTNRFRENRMARFVALLDGVILRKGTAHILDVGGTIGYWKLLEPVWAGRPVRLTIVNLGVEPREEGPFALRPGDACAMPEYADNSFDIVHSNSVIEHVGRWDQMAAMAREIRRLAPVHFVQTPNIWFPVEPHFKLPFVHWLPEQLQARLLYGRAGRYVPRGAPFEAAIRIVQGINLLSTREFKILFPDSIIERERFLMLTKSLIAVRDADDVQSA